MNALASLPAATPTLTRPRVEPVVFIDGCLEPRLQPEYVTYRSPLDRRDGIVRSDWTVSRNVEMRWQHGRAELALPQRLSDQQPRWVILAAGSLQRVDEHETAGQRDKRFYLREDWSQVLDQTPATIPWVSPTGALIAEPEGTFALGRVANRSTQRYSIAGQSAYVFQRTGQPWTVGSALETLSAIGGLGLSLHLLPPNVARASLNQTLKLDQPIGDLLETLLQANGLVMQRSLDYQAGRLRERRAVRPLQHGRAVSVRWPNDQQPLSDVMRLNRQAPRAAAQPWIAQASPWLIESTFSLVAGWDPALAGESDSEYGRTTSSDFSRYANVYRQWVLNEDGAFTGEPYNRGDPFDLTSFFPNHSPHPQPLRFRACLTLADARQRLPPIVEISTDGGGTWQRYGGEALILQNRAGVYLNDATLPSAFLTAAKNGDARVRVTASLQSPQPVTERRWRGNPFAGQRPARRFDVAEAFRFQRVDTSSIHRPAIDAGSLEASEVNQRDALAAWLVERMNRSDARNDEAGQATLTLAGAWPMLRIGDHLDNAGGQTETLDTQAQRLQRHGAQITALTVHFPVAQGQGPNTTVQLSFS